MDALKLDHQLCFALYAASRAVTQAYGPLLEPLGLTYPQYLVMLVLWEQDGVSVGTLGDRLLLDSGTLTPLLKRMESMGLLKRTRSSQDERVVIIALTAQGRALRNKAKGVPAELVCRLGKPTQPHIAQLREQLMAITHAARGPVSPGSGD
jgi:DNA-binding MarR family transcriptional regulator